MDFSKVKRGYFVGIGGVGVNALARFATDFGIEVSGSDAKVNGLCAKLVERGAIIGDEPNFDAIDKADFLVFSSAIPSDNPEIARAKERGIPVFERHEFLGEVASLFGKVVGIAGTHGKTTTSAMLTQILFENGVKFASMIGGESIDFSNYVNNTGAKSFADLKDCTFACEACEYKRNLLALPTDVAVVLNAECDHPDCYENLESVKSTFAEFLQKAKVKIVCDEYADLVDGDCRQKETSGFCVRLSGEEKEKVRCFYNGKNAIYSDGKLMASAKLQDDGEYNYKNAAFALAAAKAIGQDFKKSVRALTEYRGVKRRFERAQDIAGAKVYFDFAHHPSEIASLINRAKPMGKILVVFQPHTYSRTKAYLNDFAKVLGVKNNGVKTLAIMPTYAAREIPRDGVESDELVKAIFDKFRKRNVYLVKDKQSTVDFVKSQAKNHDVILMIGAGDIYDLKELL